MSTPDPSDLQPRELLQIAADFFESQKKGEAIDFDYIETWATKRNVGSEWQLVKQRLGADGQ